MARKNYNRYKVLSAQSLAASFNSPPTVINTADNCSYQINITTTNSTGTFAVQVSDDYQINETTQAVMNPGTWVSLTLAGGTPVANAANDTIVISLNQLPYTAMRLSYTRTVAGTGVCDVWVTEKMLG